MKTKKIKWVLFNIAFITLSINAAAESGITGAADPTKPPAEVIARMGDMDKLAAGNIVLNGIKHDGKTSLAILNGDLVKLGDIYQGYRLMYVSDSHVILEDESHQKLKLSMNIVDFKKQEKHSKRLQKNSDTATNAKSVYKTN